MDLAQTPEPSKRVSIEQNKVRQTTHWDMDYLPFEEIDALYARQSASGEQPPSAAPPSEEASKRRLGLVCIVCGLGLLALAVGLARYFGS
jgi:hypothetical protein